MLVRLSMVADIAALNAGEAASADESKANSPTKKRVSVNAVRINNNELPELIGLAGALESHVRDPAQVMWIDASFNKLKGVSAGVRCGRHTPCADVVWRR